MNPEENPLECEVCGEKKPSIIHTVYQNSVYRRRCTDCLLKEHRALFCPICFIALSPPDQRIACHKCTSTAHVSCLLPSPSPFAASSSSSFPLPPLAYTFTCPPCTDPNFTFYPKSYVNIDKPDTPHTFTCIRAYWGKALAAAANISANILKQAAAQLKEVSLKKIIAAKEAKMKAKAALENLQLVLSQKTSPNNNS